jgi:5-methylcytosine-specific restriction endonuclease McrBC GTP-binding regulatory subunit McrB
MSDSEIAKQQQREFLEAWPLEKLKEMTLEEYTNLNRDNSFCYWLEKRTEKTGSIWGGSAYKFGIYRKRNTTKEDKRENTMTDGEYAWYSKFGRNAEDAFSAIKEKVVLTASKSIEEEFEDIDEIDLSNVVKWKIAFLYNPKSLLPIFKKDWLVEANKPLLENAHEKTYFELQRSIVSTKPENVPTYEFGRNIWEKFWGDEQEESNSEKSSESDSKKYWLYSPGENARLWNECNIEGIVALGWDKLGDLSNLKSKKEIKNALFENYGGDGSKKNDTTANYEFLNSIKIGDIVIAKRGRHELLGYGTISSNYHYDEEREEYKHVREIEWKVKGSWPVAHSLALKTLTDITKYESETANNKKYYDELMDIMVGETKSFEQEFRTWLTNNSAENSGKIHSYINAIKILSTITGRNLFEVTDDKYLQELYKDVKKEQEIPNGKYFYAEKPSYGSYRYYSASIKSYREFLKSSTPASNKNDKMNFPLNTIFYGPPGTGKTYNTVQRAAEIILNRPILSYSEALKTVKDNLHNRVEFITFHQNYSYEDFIQGLRPDTENDKDLTFERKDGVFKKIADSALKNLLDSENPPTEKKSFEEVFNSFISPLIEGELEEIEVKMKKVSFFITSITSKSIEFRKDSGGTGHTLSLATLGKMYEAETIRHIQGLTSYYQPLLEKLLLLGKDSTGRKANVQGQNYVIVIDEINRANISRVFGELITLIEPDKRSHGKIPLEVRLPSEDKFMVPSNLYIIGTMNTADKSIALLDIALRRRFEFESMYPLYEIEGQTIHDTDILEKINREIIKSKGHDFQIGHAYFMNENDDLVQRMNKKVIPLLLEYYMNDEKEVKGILKTAGLTIEENSWPIRITGKSD